MLYFLNIQINLRYYIYKEKMNQALNLRIVLQDKRLIPRP